MPEGIRQALSARAQTLHNECQSGGGMSYYTMPTTGQTWESIPAYSRSLLALAYLEMREHFGS